MSRRICETVFQFSDLEESSKEAARQWYRENAFADCWWDTVYEDAAMVADILGIDLRTRKVQFRNGETRYDGINIGFSGFSCQGDGAHFQGSYSYAKGAAKAIREYAPKDTVLHGIADSLQSIQRNHFYKLKASVKHSGHYQHQYCTDIEVAKEDRDGYDLAPGIEVEKEVSEILRSFMQWIYCQLEKEYEFRNSDEVVDEEIASNGYEFTESGGRSISIH